MENTCTHRRPTAAELRLAARTVKQARYSSPVYQRTRFARSTACQPTRVRYSPLHSSDGRVTYIYYNTDKYNIQITDSHIYDYIIIQMNTIFK